MTAWAELTREETDAVWDRFRLRFRFRPGVHRHEWPGIAEPTPSATFSLVDGIQRAKDRAGLLAIGAELNSAVLDALQLCTARDESLYALDWQHPCYRFFPHRPFETAGQEQWVVPVFPDGDYSVFLQQDFDVGTFSHPWEQTLCVFGERMLHVFDPESLPWLGSPIRRDGVAV